MMKISAKFGNFDEIVSAMAKVSALAMSKAIRTAAGAIPCMPREVAPSTPIFIGCDFIAIHGVNDVYAKYHMFKGTPDYNRFDMGDFVMYTGPQARKYTNSYIAATLMDRGIASDS